MGCTRKVHFLLFLKTWCFRDAKIICGRVESNKDMLGNVNITHIQKQLVEK